MTKWLDLIQAMTDGQNHTANELAEVLGTSVRNLYYTLDVLRESGFEVVHEGRNYHLHPRSRSSNPSPRPSISPRTRPCIFTDC